jgi:hypothetical protein
LFPHVPAATLCGLLVYFLCAGAWLVCNFSELRKCGIWFVMIELDIGACVCCVCLMSVAMNYAVWPILSLRNTS